MSSQSKTEAQYLKQNTAMSNEHALSGKTCKYR